MDEEKKVLSDNELEEVNGGAKKITIKIKPNDEAEKLQQDDSLAQENAFSWPRG